jgi:hypothetical protein
VNTNAPVVIRKIMKHPNRKNHISDKVVYAIPLFLLLVLNQCIGAGWAGTDDFSSGISTTNWAVQQMSHGQMTVAGTNSHASFLVPISTTNEQNAYIIWHGTPTAAENWMVDILGRNSAPYSSGGGSALQLVVIDTASLSSVLEGFVVTRNNSPIYGSIFGTTQVSGSGYTGRTSVGSTVTNFGLRLVYHSASEQIEAWYDPSATGSGWTKLDTISLTDFSPSMTATNTFTFAIISDTYYGPISEGQIWADNFRALPAPPLLLVASAQRSGSSEVVKLTWTNNGSVSVLESAGALSGSWGAISTPWTTNAGWVSTAVTNTSSVQFYRLRAN